MINVYTASVLRSSQGGTLLEDRGGAWTSFVIDWRLIQADALEESKWHKLDEESPDKLTRSESDAEQVLIASQWISFCDPSTDFHNNHLDHECEDDDRDEKWVSEDTFKDVKLIFLEFSGVQLIEQLHEDESLEDMGVVKKLLGLISFFVGCLRKSNSL